MRFNDSVFGVVLIVFAILEIAYAQTFPRLFGQDYGPDLFPVLIGVGLIVFGGILVVRGVAQRATVPMVTVGDWAQDRNNVLNVVVLVACIVFYILASEWLGFVPISILILTILLLRLGSGPVLSVSVALITTMLIHSLFAKVLLVPLPWGLLQPIAW